MPLHLLGKKSWNVYNPEAIARVRKDEAQAKAQEADRERQEKAHHAEQRLLHLKAHDAEAYTATEPLVVKEHQRHKSEYGSVRKRRRLAGENDTDRDLRLAREDLLLRRDPSPTDRIEHDRSTVQRRQDEQIPEQEQGMRFRDAAGIKQVGQTPWYTRDTSKSNNNIEQPTLSSGAVGHDVWGNEDPRRHARQQQRQIVDDPLLAIKKGVKRLRDNEKQKTEWKVQREKDLTEVEVLAKAKAKERHHRRRDDHHHHSRRHSQQRQKENNGDDDDDDDDDDAGIGGFRLDDDENSGINNKSQEERSELGSYRDRDRRRHRDEHRHGHRHDHRRGHGHSRPAEKDLDKRRHRS